MARSVADIPEAALARFRKGTAIPAHPLALTAARALDETRQRALSRYYIDAGAGGLAVGVHTTQFAIREAGLYEPVLRLAGETAADRADGPLFLIAGVAGRTGQAVAEAQVAAGLGYHAVLLSLAAFRNASEDELIAHCRRIGEEMPVVGFYLQPAVGGVPLPFSFWRRFAELDAVVGIKIAPFDRYGTLDVVRGVAEAGAEDRIALYTGNDDNILLDLLTPWRLKRGDKTVDLRIAGGLLGHWSVWVRSVVTLLDRVHAAAGADRVDRDLLALAGQITDCNAAFFDVANDFRGCIAGMHEVLRRQGLLEGIWCLDPDESLSPGQAEEIDRVCRAYPHLNDDSFVAENLERWLAP
ncbi:MAG: dihydrodipicolinate synthase family protein [Rhodospirillaceae bacterium]|nr:dihydrodipicolinate synthase family protein [Rhodospirillaceae bacterium]